MTTFFCIYNIIGDNLSSPRIFSQFEKTPNGPNLLAELISWPATAFARNPQAVPVLPVAGGMMPPVPTMPFLSHHHHHEQHRQQQQQPQQRHHQYNLPPQPPHQQNPPTCATATCITPILSPAHVPAAAPSGDTVVSRDGAPPDSSGVPALPATAVAPGLPGMTGAPGIEIKREPGFPCMFGLESMGVMELAKNQV